METLSQNLLPMLEFWKVSFTLFPSGRRQTEQFSERLSKDKPNLDVLEEYRRRDIEYRDRVNELDHVTERRDAQKKIHEDLQKKRLDEFMTGFQQISLKLKEMYQVRALFHWSLLYSPKGSDDHYWGQR